MTALLVAVTLVSLGLAGALLVYALKLSRDERDRSEARATALAELLEAHTSSDAFPSATAPISAHERVPFVIDEPVNAPALPTFQEISEEPAPLRWSSEAETESPEAPLRHEPANMFGSTTAADDRAGSPRWLLVPAIGVIIVGFALSAVYLWNRPTGAHQTAQDAPPPLELVTLRHQRLNDTLVITGLVRNPPDAAVVKGLVAVAFAFDRQGTFVQSGRAVLDFPQLRAGEESPFSITIPQAGTVGRYRVSFRTEAGIVPHVDRRAATPAAVQQASAR
jgi:hypothetical protein